MPSTSNWKVALLIETARGYGRQVLRGIVDYANHHGHWSFYVTPGDFEQALPEMERWGGTGIIARIMNPQLARGIAATGLPTIALDMPEERTDSNGAFHGFSELATDSFAAAKMAAEHLLSKGFKHYAFVGTPGHVWSDRREKSFCERITAAGFAPRAFRTSRRKRKLHWAVEQEALAQWLRALPKPIGLMACNDDRGREVLEACRTAQIEVPEEIAVIGVDNDSLLCDLASPPLSSVALNAERGGFEAAELLEKLMARRVTTPHKIVVEPLYIVNRHSTNIVAVDDTDVAAAMRFIRDHSGQPLRVHEVADAVGLSRRMLEIRFRAALGRSLNDEIQRVHLEMAKRLLTETDWPMEKVALASGYNGASYLSVLFQRFLKLNPTEYRRRVRSL
jgi:LacI family transcriptional regulator